MTETHADPATDIEAQLPPPPVSPALSAALAALAPVRTRVPARAFAIVLAVGLVSVLAAVLQFGPRSDLGALPPAWVIGMGLVWAIGGPFLVARATLPRAGSVLPDAGRAGRSAVAVALGLVFLGLVATVDAPGATEVPATFAGGFWHCAVFALRITLPVLLVGAFVLRRLHPMGAGRLAAAIGAAGGAWAGFVLHVICPLGGGAHVGLAHGGAALIGAGVGGILGATVLGRLLR